MQQNRMLFFGIIGLALLIVIGMGLARLFIPEIGPANVLIQVVTAPSIKPWVEESAQQFNQTNGRIEVQVLTANTLVPTSQFASSSPQAVPPAAWLAEATFMVEMARHGDYAFDDSQSVAATSMAWGGYNDKLSQFEAYGGINWPALNKKATDDILKLVIASPQNTAEGLAALMSAAAVAQNSQSLTTNEISAANGWLAETLGDRNTVTPPTPAETLASVQGRTLGDIGLLSLASWRGAKLDSRTDFQIIPLDPNVALDFPFAIYTDSKSPVENQAAARAFRDFLLAEAQQNRLSSVYLDKAATVAPGGVQIDGSGIQRLYNSLNQILR
jgi:ABC-type molybdate transport system substrate-binding protein